MHIQHPLSDPAFLEGMKKLHEAIQRLQTATVENTEARTRAVAVMAKNLKLGDLVEWGFDLGPCEVVGWSRDEDRVLLATSGGKLWPVPCDQRIKVYR